MTPIVGRGEHRSRTSRKSKKALTLDDLGGVASNVSFVRTDARAAAPTQLSRTKLKQAFDWELTPQWPLLTADDATNVLRYIASISSSTSDSSPRPTRLCVGRAAVARALRRTGELAAVLLARDAGPPLLSAHLAALVQDSETVVCALACSSAQLGQPFGLLRASAVGVKAAHQSAEADALMTVLRSAVQQQQPAGPLPWLQSARKGLLSERQRREELQAQSAGKESASCGAGRAADGA